MPMRPAPGGTSVFRPCRGRPTSPRSSGKNLAQDLEEALVVFRQGRGDSHESGTEERVTKGLDEDSTSPELFRQSCRIPRSEIREKEICPGGEGLYTRVAEARSQLFGPGPNHDEALRDFFFVLHGGQGRCLTRSGQGVGVVVRVEVVGQRLGKNRIADAAAGQAVRLGPR